MDELLSPSSWKAERAGVAPSRGKVALFRIRLLLLKAVLASKTGIQIILEEELTVRVP